MTIIQNEDEKIKEVHMMPVRDIRATEGSKSSQQKANKTEASNGFGWTKYDIRLLRPRLTLHVMMEFQTLIRSEDEVRSQNVINGKSKCNHAHSVKVQEPG